jgi:hypothetical protein
MFQPIIKTLIIFTVIIVALTIIGELISSSINADITASISYFLNFINYLNPIVDVSVIFICLKILTNFILSIILFRSIIWIVHLTV